MWFKKYTQKIVLVAALLCVFFISLPVKAENLGMCRDVRDKKCYLDFIKNNNETTTERKYWIPLQVPIPFPACDAVDNFLCVQGNIVGLRSIADLVVGLFQFGIIAIGITMVLTLVIGGAVYLTAGGSADYVNKAKDMMTKSFWGLLVALLSFTILYQVDPMLTTPNLTKLQTVEGVPCCKIANSEKDFYFAQYDSTAEKYQCKANDEIVGADKCLFLSHLEYAEATMELIERPNVLEVPSKITGDKTSLINQVKNSGIIFKSDNKYILMNHLSEMKEAVLRSMITARMAIKDKELVVTSLNEPVDTHTGNPHCSGSAVDFRVSNLKEEDIKAIYTSLYSVKDVSQFLYCMPAADGQVTCPTPFGGFNTCKIIYFKAYNGSTDWVFKKGENWQKRINVACTHRDHIHVGTYPTDKCTFVPGAGEK